MSSIPPISSNVRHRPHGSTWHLFHPVNSAHGVFLGARLLGIERKLSTANQRHFCAACSMWICKYCNTCIVSYCYRECKRMPKEAKRMQKEAKRRQKGCIKDAKRYRGFNMCQEHSTTKQRNCNNINNMQMRHTHRTPLFSIFHIFRWPEFYGHMSAGLRLWPRRIIKQFCVEAEGRKKERPVASGEFQAFGVNIQWRNSHWPQFVLNVGYPIARLFAKARVWHLNALICLSSTKINPD